MTATIATRSLPTPPCERVRVLVVGCGDTRAATFDAAGYQIREEGWIAFDELDRSDLLVLALAPPEPPAAALVRQLRVRASTPILVLTRDASEQERAAVLEAGADGYVASDASDAELVSRVGQLLHTPVRWDARVSTSVETLPRAHG